MAVPSTFADLSATPASNSGLISDSSNVNTIDDHFRTVYAFIASVYANSGNGWASPFLTAANPSYTGTLTGGTGVVNIGSGQFYKEAAGNVGIGTASPVSFNVQGGPILAISGAGATFVLNDTGSASKWALLGRTGASTNQFRVFDAVAAADRLVIDGSGNVGAGTSSPAARLDIAGAVRMSNTTTPSTPTGGGILYVEGGALKFIGSSGTVTTVAPA